MEFPDYVPPAVCTHIERVLEGDKKVPYGWAATLANAESELSKITAQIAANSKNGNSKYLDSLRERKLKSTEDRDMLAKGVGCLQRLATDIRMRDAFSLLTQEFTDPDQWRRFISAAWSAQINYQPYRESVKRAKVINEKIIKTAGKLAQLIHEFEKTGVYGPSEFHSVSDLLRNTDNHESEDRNLQMWRSMRKHVLGDSIGLGESLASDPMAGVRYGWQVSPSFPALLETVVTVACDFKPRQFGMVDAAVSNRQGNEKNEYLRAFTSQLPERHNFNLTPRVLQAIVIVATVVIDDPQFEITLADVQRAIAQ